MSAAICMYMYVSSADLHVLSIQEFSMVSRTSKTTELSQLSGGYLGGDGCLSGTIQYKHTSFLAILELPIVQEEGLMNEGRHYLLL